MSTDRIWVLLGKKKSGEASAEELQELELLMSSVPSSGFTNEILDKIWEAPLHTIPESKISSTRWDLIQKKIAGSGQGSRIFFPYGWKKWTVAASLLLVAGSLVILYLQIQKSILTHSSAQLGKINHVTTQQGSKSKIELPDGTQVWLNGNSQLAYGNGNFGTQMREVSLTGEAFFDVVRNEKVPFIIHTGIINITVKGTAFNVKAYPNEKTIETSLVRGLIEITTQQDPDRKILLKANEKIIIPVGPSADETKRKENPSNGYASVYTITSLKRTGSPVLPETAWMQNKLQFDNEPFDELAPKMEDRFNIKIHFLDNGIRSRRFSGVIAKETLKETLEAMQLSYHFSYEIKGNDLWIKKIN
jgi:transmembrane sensor